jgi:deoxyribodipyrimidine photo-lyase
MSLVDNNPNGPMPIRLIWHRRDLRLHDNALYSDVDDTTSVASLFVFNDSDFEPRPSTCRPEEWDAVNIGPHAARILLESVDDLGQSLRSIGGELMVRQGSPARIIPEIIQELGATEVYWNEEPGIYEQHLSKQVFTAIRQRFPNVRIQTSMQYTLYHPEDLPFGEQEWEKFAQPNKQRSKKKKNKRSSPSPERRKLPDGQIDITPERWKGMSRIMGDFRRAAREKTGPRSCLPAPVRLQTTEPLPAFDDIPTLETLLQPLLLTSAERPILGLSHATIQEVIANAQARQESSDPAVHRGGERAALDHLQDFCANHAGTAGRNLACVYDHQSMHISHFLAFGCLSPRKVVEQAQTHGKDCSWIISHITMRDFFLYTCLASQHQFYRLTGIPVSKKASKSVIWKSLDDANTKLCWERWALGKTGLPLIDAAMKELNQTGYCSNRVRQNAASLLTKDLGIDWRAGAECFQFLLEDHCVGANWGNWLYFSGVGPDPKQRHFRTVSQALRYDPEGSYVRQWLPELTVASHEGDEDAHLRPWDFSDDWKDPIVDPGTQFTWQDLQRLQETGRLFFAN